MCTRIVATTQEFSKQGIVSNFFAKNYSPEVQSVAFDEEFLRVRGIRTRLHYITLLVLAAVTIVLLTSIVGVILVIAGGVYLMTMRVRVVVRRVVRRCLTEESARRGEPA